MRKIGNYCKKEKCKKGFPLALFGAVLLITLSSYAGPMGDVRQNLEKVKSIEPHSQLAMLSLQWAMFNDGRQPKNEN